MHSRTQKQLTEKRRDREERERRVEALYQAFRRGGFEPNPDRRKRMDESAK